MCNLAGNPLERDAYSHLFNAATVKSEDLVKSGVAASARRQSGRHRCPAGRVIAFVIQNHTYRTMAKSSANLLVALLITGPSSRSLI